MTEKCQSFASLSLITFISFFQNYIFNLTVFFLSFHIYKEETFEFDNDKSVQLQTKFLLLTSLFLSVRY